VVQRVLISKDNQTTSRRWSQTTFCEISPRSVFMMLLRGSRTFRVGVELQAKDKSILRDRNKKPACEELGIRAFAFSMKMFSSPKLDTVAK
jgi:hypothetical protein